MVGLDRDGNLALGLAPDPVDDRLVGAWAAAAPPHEVRALLMVGVLGGFTTFSAFALENLQLLRTGHAGLALLNLLASNILGIGLAGAGYYLARSFSEG